MQTIQTFLAQHYIISIPLFALMSYFVGCISPSYFLGKKKKGIDIRDHGSCNAGASNAVIMLGWKYGVLTALIDILKGSLMSFLATILTHDMVLIHTAVLFVVLGHIFPFYLKFKGGKGLATMCGAVFGYWPLVAVAMFFLLWTVAFISNYLIIGTITLTIFYLGCSLFYHDFNLLYAVVPFIFFVLITSKHIPNIKRIKLGEEKKFRDMVIKKKN